MPIALLIAGRGDDRDAVGLFLAGRGWTTLPAAAEPEAARAALHAVQAELVAVDARVGAGAAAACVRAVRGDGPVPVVVLNAGDDVRGDLAGLPAVTFADGPDQVPAAPGVPLPPHAA